MCLLYTPESELGLYFPSVQALHRFCWNVTECPSCCYSANMDPVHSEAMHMIIKMPTEKDLVSPACVPLDRRQESRSSSQSLLKDTMATAGWCQDFSSTAGHPGTSSPMAQETIILNSQELDLLFSTTTCRMTFTTTAAKLPGTTHLSPCGKLIVQNSLTGTLFSFLEP